MIDFPASPVNGQSFIDPTTSLQWVWDGTKWTASGVTAAYLPLTGGTMTGPIVLAADPAANLQAATKQYVDNATNLLRLGVTDGSNAPAGQIGEYISGSLASTGIANSVFTNLIQLNLTAGDWDVEGNAQYTYATGAGATAMLGVSSVSGSMGTLGGQARITLQNNILNTATIMTGAQRFSLTATTPIYLVGYSGFTTSTSNVAAVMRARRMR